MKKILLLLLISCNCSAQYFDWNDFIFQTTGSHQGAEVVRLQASPQGNLILNFLRTDFGWPTNYESVLNTSGAFISAYNDIQSGNYRNTSFDHKGNYIEVQQNDTGYVLSYFRQNDTLYLYPYGECTVKGDSSGVFYLFFGNDSVQVYDVSGNYMNTVQHPYVSAEIDDAGNIYFAEYNTALTITKLHNDGSFISSYAGFIPFAISRNGKVALKNNNALNVYDTTGMLTATIPILPGAIYPPVVAFDSYDNLYIWNDKKVSKYSADTLSWSTMIESDYVTHMAVDDSMNIYYAGMFILNDSYSGNGFTPGLIDIPPRLYEVCDVFENGFGSNFWIFFGKIANAQPDSFFAGMSVDRHLCTSSEFTAGFYYYQMPVVYADDTIYIELSDAAGQFTDPYIIGKGFCLGVTCIIPDSVPEGSNYKIRANINNGLYYTQEVDSVNIKHSPAAPILLYNSIKEMYACPPLILKTNSNPGLSYSWYQLTDPFPDDPLLIIDLNQHDSILILTSPVNYWYKVIVIDTVSGCSSESSALFPEEIDSTYAFDQSILLPDTISNEADPVNIYLDKKYQLTGSGLSITPLTNYNLYTFNPATAIPGRDTLLLTVPHDGTPCVAYEYLHFVYVDSVPVNIILDSVSSNPYICAGDTQQFYFDLIDSSIYNASNVFTVVMGYRNQQKEFVYLSDIGSGISSPVTAVYPSAVGFNTLRFRVYSSQTGGYSTLNPDGNKSFGGVPAAWFYGGLSDSSFCFPLNDSIQVISNYS
ncbi:MAG: hypothetical protein ABI772_03425, partial [Bacteroidota bacterium]